MSVLREGETAEAGIVVRQREPVSLAHRLSLVGRWTPAVGGLTADPSPA